jgi:hypothetical protein
MKVLICIPHVIFKVNRYLGGTRSVTGKQELHKYVGWETSLEEVFADLSVLGSSEMWRHVVE